MGQGRHTLRSVSGQVEKSWVEECADHGSLHQSGHNNGVIETARCFGTGTLGSGRILASFHCLGTVDVASDTLNK